MTIQVPHDRPTRVAREASGRGARKRPERRRPKPVVSGRVARLLLLLRREVLGRLRLPDHDEPLRLLRLLLDEGLLRLPDHDELLRLLRLLDER